MDSSDSRLQVSQLIVLLASTSKTDTLSALKDISFVEIQISKGTPEFQCVCYFLIANSFLNVTISEQARAIVFLSDSATRRRCQNCCQSRLCTVDQARVEQQVFSSLLR